MNNPLNFPLDELCTLRATRDTDRSVKKERNLLLPMMKTVFGQYSFSYRAAKSWNELPAHVQNAKSVLDFSGKLNKHIVSIRPGNYVLRYF